jgi:hypothetical protein
MAGHMAEFRCRPSSAGAESGRPESTDDGGRGGGGLCARCAVALVVSARFCHACGAAAGGLGAEAGGHGADTRGHGADARGPSTEAVRQAKLAPLPRRGAPGVGGYSTSRDGGRRTIREGASA